MRIPRFRLVVLAFITSAASAQTAPDAGILLESQKLNVPDAPLPSTAPVIKRESEQSRPAAPSDMQVTVKRFELEGNIQVFSRETLLKLLAADVGRAMSLNDLRAAADRISNYYRARGYLLARAILPAQEVTGGVVRIVVSEGVLDEKAPVKINGLKLRLDTTLANRVMTNAVPPGQAVKQDDLERGILLLRDLPGITTSANLEPGETPGSTRIVMDISEGPLLQMTLSLDNFGSRYTGANRVTGGLAINNPSGLGDQVTATVTTALDGAYDYWRLGYSLPLGVSGLRVGIAYSDLIYKLGKEFKSLNSKGRAENWTLTARYPLVRTRLNSLYFDAAYDWKRLYNESSGAATSDKRIDLYSAGVTWEVVDQFWGGGFTQAGVKWLVGDLDLSRVASSLSADQGASGARTQGGFNKWNWSVIRIQRGMEKLTLQGVFAGQSAAKNLDSAEKFQLGGPTGVRAYPVGEGVGDDGMRATLEARYLAWPGSVLGDINLIGFYDWGRISQFHNPAGLTLTTPNTYSLAGYGLGLAVGKPGQFDFKLTWATKAGTNPARSLSTGNDADGRADASRWWGVLQVNF